MLRLVHEVPPACRRQLSPPHLKGAIFAKKLARQAPEGDRKPPAKRPANVSPLGLLPQLAPHRRDRARSSMSSAVESVGRLGPQSQDWRTPIAAGQEGKAAHSDPLYVAGGVSSANQAATTNEQLSSKSWTQEDGAGRRQRQPAPQSASQRKVVADHAASTAQYEREAAAYAQFYAQPGRGGSAQRYNRNRVVQDHSASAAQYARDVAYYAQYQQLPTAHEQQQQQMQMQPRGGRRGQP